MILVPLDRSAVLAPGFWRISPPVARRVRPVRNIVPAAPSSVPWRLALDAIPNKGDDALGYDEWWKIIAAIWHETRGSDEGLAVAQAWSARSAKHDPDFLEQRIWAYLSDKAVGVTGGTIMSLATRLAGWVKPIDLTGFGPVDARGVDLPGNALPIPLPGRRESDDDEDLTGIGLVALPSGAVVSRAALEDVVEAAEDREGVPAALHKCTDQANANRLVREHGRSLLVCAGSWYAWDGKRWAKDESALYRFACNLSRVIKDEARAIRARSEGGDAAAIKAADEVAKALDAWSTKSEMKGTIEAAIGLARKMLDVPPETLDANPWLLCCENGTVDLRSGLIRAHRREDRITKLTPTVYRPGARSLAWERAVLMAACGDETLARFLKRWWGYCTTGSTREQKFAVLWGAGGNGKSVLVGAIDAVLGSYAGTAASGLMAGGKASNVHSSAVVALVGKRLVTAHETGEGNVLAEDFVKKATGGDKMEARYLFAEQFDFMPTHKLQLLTNYKPTIKGQDRGIWRRVLLVPFLASFGTDEDVAAGRAKTVGDPLMGEYLKREEEREGILAWLVAGAMEWYGAGLREPDVVRAATMDYQVDQDRVGQFVDECCEKGDDFDATLSDVGMEPGLYHAYVTWCKDGGVFPLSKRKFLEELLRVVPGAMTRPGRTPKAQGRAKVTRVTGLRLLASD